MLNMGELFNATLYRQSCEKLNTVVDCELIQCRFTLEMDLVLKVTELLKFLVISYCYSHITVKLWLYTCISNYV